MDALADRPATAADVARLEQLLSELRAIVEDLALRMLKPSDQRDLAILLPLARQAFGASSWTAPEVAIRAINLTGDEGDLLRELVARHTDEAGGARPLGKLLARCAGCTAAGWRLVRESGGDSARDRDGQVFSVRPARVCLDPGETHRAGGQARG